MLLGGENRIANVPRYGELRKYQTLSIMQYFLHIRTKKHVDYWEI